jgi:hypothetical protein
LRTTHLPSAVTATASPADPNRLQALLLLIPLDLFALFRWRSTGGDVLNDIARFSYDAVQHQSGQLRSGTEAGCADFQAAALLAVS